MDKNWPAFRIKKFFEHQIQNFKVAKSDIEALNHVQR